MASNNIISVDFSDVKESSGINPRHQPEGDYLLKITQVEMKKTKGDDPKPMLFILMQDVNMRSATYPYYCTFQPNMLWKVRNVFIAAGQKVPKGKGKLDINKLLGAEVGVTLIDDEYEGKMKSVIDSVFHKDELEPVEAEEDDNLDEDEDDFEEEEVEEEAPAPKKSKKKAAPEPEPEEDDEDEDDEEEEEEPAPVKKKSKKSKPAPVEEDEDEDDDELDLDDI